MWAVQNTPTIFGGNFRQTKEKAESATRFDRTWRENIIITRHVHLCASFDASSTVNRKNLLDFALLTF